MLQQPTKSHLESLTGPMDHWCVSIFLPTHRCGKEVREDPIRLKNRVSEAESQLAEAGVDQSDIDRICGTVRQFCTMDSDEARDFWRHQADSLAVFASPDATQFFPLSEDCDELTVVSKRYHVRPLLRSLQRDQEYCVLAVSRNGVRFFEGSRSGLHQRDVGDLPESLQAVVGGDHQRGFGLHSFRVRANGGDNAVPHGHVETNKEHELARYFREIDDAVTDAMQGEQRVLVFAGVDELFAPFKEHSNYEHVAGDFVSGNPDDLSDDDLHEQAWPIAAAVISDRLKSNMDRWQEASHTDLGGTDIEEIICAADEGRIDTLYLPQDQCCYGTFDPDSRKVDVQENSTADNYDLLDLAAARVLRADGRLVFVPDSDELPGPAAIFRYKAATV